MRPVLPDHFQSLRRVFQFAFVLQKVWISWLLIAGLMNIEYWATTGRLPATHPAAMFVFVALLAIAFLFRKAFGSWLCPVGTLVPDYLYAQPHANQLDHP